MDQKDFVQYITIKKGLALNSIRMCRIKFALINKWLKENNKELSKEAVEEFFFYLKGQGLNNNTLNTYFFVFRYIQDYLLDRGGTNRFFDSFQAFPKHKPTIIILTPDEIEHLLNIDLTYGRYGNYNLEEATEKLNFMHKTICMFLAYTGCRFDEAASLKVKYIDLSAGKATFAETPSCHPSCRDDPNWRWQHHRCQSCLHRPGSSHQHHVCIAQFLS